MTRKPLGRGLGALLSAEETGSAEQPNEIAIDWNVVIFNMLTIHGIYGREMYETWYKMTVMLESGLDIAPVITHRFSYRDFQEAFELMKSGNSGKIVMDWENI